MNLKPHRFFLQLAFTILLLAALVVAFVAYTRAEKAIDRANEQRILSQLLADELRQSSDDLTRMVRTYVVTGDPRYRQYYQDILDIRDGRKPRPEHYQNIYWDRVIADQLPPPATSGPGVPLLDLMRQAEFGAAEFHKLAEAKANSDQLTATEFAAMQQVETAGQDPEAARAKARQMLHDAPYHQAKAGIMQPLFEFNELMNQRTLAAVQAAERHALRLRGIFILFALSALLMLWRTYRVLRETLGGAVDDVHARIVRLGQGDFSSTTPVAPGRDNSVVGWLAETQRRLKQLEQVRQAAADRYASMLAATKDAFWLVDAPSGRLLDVNAAAMQMSGFSRDALLSMSMQDLEVGLTTDAYAEQMTQVLTEGWGLFESRQRISAGRIIDVEISVTFDPPSRTLVAFIRDITERKRMAQALLTFNAELEQRVARRTEELSATTSALMLTEERLRLAMDATHDGLWDWNLATDEYFTNEAYCSMLGYAAVASPTNVQDQWLNLVHPDERDSTLANVNQALQSVGDYALEFRMRARDGGYRWILSRGRVVERDATAAPARAIGTHIDITERKHAEAQLRESQANLQLAIDGAGLGIWYWHIHTDALEFSERCLALFGLPAKTPLTYALFRETLHPDDREATDRAVRQAMEDHTDYRMEYRVIWPDGSLHWISAMGRFDYTATNAPHRMQGICLDITDRKRAEAAVRDSNANLERKVAERTAQLARANRVKGEFLANMSHEIRTPLNAILGLTQILERDTLAPDQQDLLHKISEAGSSLLHIINDILDFSKIEAGQFQIDPAPFGLAALLTRLENLLTATAQRKGLTLAVRRPDGCTEQLVGDSLRIEQVLTNLIGNAIKFTAQGRVEVDVTPLAVTEPTVRLRFTITDTGVGITPEQLARLFQPFSQADGGITRRFGGTGLGLSISKRLVELMGGTIGVTSTPGQGSTFWFELPLPRAAEATPRLQPPPPITVQGPRLTGLRVLAVDDNRINLFMLQRALHLEGATVSLAADGQQALDTLRASPAAFDVVLMDIQMPVMDGLTATRTLREDPRFAELPVIALTAGVMAEERAAAQAAGMSDFLAKPLDLGQMVAVLLPYVPTRPGPD